MGTHTPNAINFPEAVRKYGDDWRINSYLEVPSHARSGNIGFAIIACGDLVSHDYVDFLIMLARGKNHALRQRNPWRYCPRCEREVKTKLAGTICCHCQTVL